MGKSESLRNAIRNIVLEEQRACSERITERVITHMRNEVFASDEVQPVTEKVLPKQRGPRKLTQARIAHLQAIASRFIEGVKLDDVPAVFQEESGEPITTAAVRELVRRHIDCGLAIEEGLLMAK